MAQRSTITAGMVVLMLLGCGTTHFQEAQWTLTTSHTRPFIDRCPDGSLYGLKLRINRPDNDWRYIKQVPCPATASSNTAITSVRSVSAIGGYGFTKGTLNLQQFGTFQGYLLVADMDAHWKSGVETNGPPYAGIDAYAKRMGGNVIVLYTEHGEISFQNELHPSELPGLQAFEIWYIPSAAMDSICEEQYRCDRLVLK